MTNPVTTGEEISTMTDTNTDDERELAEYELAEALRDSDLHHVVANLLLRVERLEEQVAADARERRVLTQMLAGVAEWASTP